MNKDNEGPVGLLLFIFAVSTSMFVKNFCKVENLKNENKLYAGSCHCGGVTFNVFAPRHLVAWDCNCSICQMKKNWHFIVNYAQFELTSGESLLTEYKFNTGVARHLFCSRCGVQAFYRPRSNPDGVAVTLACVPSDQIESYEIRKFDGGNWESFFQKSGISSFSRTK